MPERRNNKRSDGGDRRSFPRPPLWLNLLLLVLGIAGMVFARYHRDQTNTRFAAVLNEQQRTPEDTKKIKDEIAGMDLTRAEIQKEIEARLKFKESLKSEDFYLSVDTQAKKLRFYYGATVLREASVQIGESATLPGSKGKTFTFVPLKGAFPIEGKAVDYVWPVPEWVYGLNKQPVPETKQLVKDGLGKYVLFLANGYVIHSKPAEESPLKGPKPGSVMVEDEDFLAAIWARIQTTKTNVYVF